MDSRAFPGPPVLGRGVVVEAGGDVPEPAHAWPRLRIDDAVLADPDDAVATLEDAWRRRQPTVVELAVPFAALKQPEVCDQPPYELDPGFEFRRERLHFLVWANRYDGRKGDPVWHHAVRAERLGASLGDEPDGDGDVRLPDGTAVWIDGGPRTAGVVDGPVLHANQLLAGSLVPDGGAAPGDQLAPDQLAAVGHPRGSARVLAPAGSGKTRVLTARLRHLLVDRGWAGETVTALAYNTRAAQEMRSRTTDLPGAQIRTLHAFGYELIGRSRQGRPRVLDEMEVRHELERLLRLRPRANEDVYAPYLEALTEVRSGLWSPDEVEGRRDDVAGFAQAFRDYRDVLDRRGVIDFDEQIYGAIEVLLRDPEVRQWARGRCAHLLVDELQDLTPAQLLMIRLLSAPAYDVFGVGDDDQVIYGYAGADPRFLIDYTDFFPGAASYLLEVNYRCPPDVVDAASQLLSYNRQRVDKTVRASADAAPPGLRVEQRSEDGIGARLVEVVQSLLDEGAAPGDVAVLTRVNAGLLVPQVLLGEAGVAIKPAVDDRMLERTGMRAALAWLRLAQSAGERGLLSGSDLAVAVRRPSRSLSPGLMNAVGRGDWSLSRLSGFADNIDDTRLSGALAGFHDDLQRLGKLVRSEATTAELLTEIRDSVGLDRSLDRLDRSHRAGGTSHIDDLDALILVAHRHPDASDFEAWLRSQLRRNDAPDEHVTLSTIHRVKGLEWPHVVVWDATDGVFPHRLATTPAEQEEERRVFHVALTRARRTSTILARATTPSPFLAELDGSATRLKVVTSSSAPPSAAKPAASARKAGESLDAEAGERFERLREWRRERAKDDGVPAYVILHDRHLEGVARRAPQSLTELAACDGIGPTKLDRYGEAILEALAAG